MTFDFISKSRMNKIISSALICGATVLPSSICFADSQLNLEYNYKTNQATTVLNEKNNLKFLVANDAAKEKYQQVYDECQKEFKDLVSKIKQAESAENLSTLPELIRKATGLCYAVALVVEKLEKDTSIRDEKFRKETCDVLFLEAAVCLELRNGLIAVQDSKSWKPMPSRYEKIGRLIDQFKKTHRQ